MTWDAERRQLVFSNWGDDVCAGATRVPVAERAELVGLRASGLAQAVPPHGVVESPEALTLADHPTTWWRGRPRGALRVTSAQRRVTDPGTMTRNR